MRPIRKPTRLAGGGALIVLLLLLSPVSTLAQDRLRSMPGHERYARVGRAIPTSVESGGVGVVWEAGRSDLPLRARESERAIGGGGRRRGAAPPQARCGTRARTSVRGGFLTRWEVQGLLPGP